LLQPPVFSPERLVEHRKRAGLSTTGLAFHLSLSEQAAWQWEHGVTVPRAATLPRIAQVLGCSIDDLFALETCDDPDAGNAGPSKPRRNGTRHAER
jgi:transcriptional regulator with XRE-family HTH domain